MPSGRLVFSLTASALQQAWRRAKKRAGVNDLRFHDLRHEAVSSFFEMGLSVPEVALITGHKDPRMLFRYTQLRAENVAKKLRATS
jgi:integrase